MPSPPDAGADATMFLSLFRRSSSGAARKEYCANAEWLLLLFGGGLVKVTPIWEAWPRRSTHRKREKDCGARGQGRVYPSAARCKGVGKRAKAPPVGEKNRLEQTGVHSLAAESPTTVAKI